MQSSATWMACFLFSTLPLPFDSFVFFGLLRFLPPFSLPSAGSRRRRCLGAIRKHRLTISHPLCNHHPLAAFVTLTHAGKREEKERERERERERGEKIPEKSMSVVGFSRDLRLFAGFNGRLTDLRLTRRSHPRRCGNRRSAARKKQLRSGSTVGSSRAIPSPSGDSFSAQLSSAVKEPAAFARSSLCAPCARNTR